MNNLAQTVRAALLTACACGHTILDHGSTVRCWSCAEKVRR